MRNHTPVRTLALCIGVAVFVVGFTLSLSGCAEPGHVKGAKAHGSHHGHGADAKACCVKGAACKKACASNKGCKPGCKKTCASKKACKPGCTMPCCAKKKADAVEKPATPDKPQAGAAPDK